jgi:hypothetical protein
MPTQSKIDFLIGQIFVFVTFTLSKLIFLSSVLKFIFIYQTGKNKLADLQNELGKGNKENEWVMI